MATNLINTDYAASGNFTITLASLANNAIRQSTVVDNSSLKYMDYHVSGLITPGSNASGNTIEVFLFRPYNDTTYPAGLGASDATVTFDSRDQLFESCVLIATLTMEGTTNRPHYVPHTSVAAAFNGWVPSKFGILVNNLSNAALNSTGGNHVLSYKPIFSNIVEG